MYYEVIAIIVCKFVYILLRPHRFVFNFGFGFDESSKGES